MHPVPCPGHQNAGVFQARLAEPRRDPLHHAGGKAQSGGAIQDTPEPYRQVFPCGDARTEDRGHHREGVGDVPQAGKGEGAMKFTPGGQSALLRPWHFPRPPPLTLSPSKPAVPAEKKVSAHPFSAGKNLEPPPWSATGFFAPNINKTEVIFL